MSLAAHVSSQEPASEIVLNVDSISIAFGGLKAVSDFSLKLKRGGLYGLIGPNGAGKTTVFNLLTGVYEADEGTISLEGRRLNGLKPYQRAAAGLARTFQNIRLFRDLSVLDNVRIACHQRACTTMSGAVVRTRHHVGEERAVEEHARRLLAIFDLEDRRDDDARNLPYGDQRRLEIARALATGPKVLLLDEPAAGMNPQEKRHLRELIRKVLNEFGLTILLIEHDMGVVMDICGRITVLDHGCIIAEGEPRAIQSNPKVIEAYLGAPEVPAANGAGGAHA
jgi:branched-chain amino acid transport system ATP-binding protein